MSHPYYPKDIILPHYKPNVSSTAEVLAVFFVVIGIVLLVTWKFSSRLKTGERLKICWFVMCGVIHMVLEGYFSVFHATIAGRNSYLAQMCKYHIFYFTEYSLNCINLPLKRQSQQKSSAFLVC